MLAFDVTAATSNAGWDGGTRTHYIGVKVRCVTITLHPKMSEEKRPAPPASSLWGGIWGSNPRHPEPQSGALPTELIPPNRPGKPGAYTVSHPAGQSPIPGAEGACERMQQASSDVGTPRGIRTPDLLLRRQLLYPAELLAHINPRQPLLFMALERVMGIEPTYPAWKAGVLPLNYTRASVPLKLRNNTILGGIMSTVF